MLDKEAIKQNILRCLETKESMTYGEIRDKLSLNSTDEGKLLSSYLSTLQNENKIFLTGYFGRQGIYSLRSTIKPNLQEKQSEEDPLINALKFIYEQIKSLTSISVELKEIIDCVSPSKLGALLLNKIKNVKIIDGVDKKRE